MLEKYFKRLEGTLAHPPSPFSTQVYLKGVVYWGVISEQLAFFLKKRASSITFFTALIFLAGIATGFAESFIKSKGISNMTTWGKRVGGVIVVFAGIYLFHLGVIL